MSIEYDYDEKSATNADKAADRITEGGPYIGAFTRAEAVVSSKAGANGIKFEFTAPGNGKTEFTLWTRGADNTEYFGMDQVRAIQFLLGMKGKLTSAPGKVTDWDDVDGTRKLVEKDGDVFPDLCNKPIGIVLQKELYSTNKGETGERMNLYGLFQPETKLMMSEIKERKSTPVKLDRLLRGLKVKDTRKRSEAEPAQPSTGAIAAGDY